MNTNTGKEPSFKFVLCLLLLVTYIVPVLFKSFFVHALGRTFLTTKEGLLLAAVFVLATAFDLKPMDQVIMVVSGAIFLLLLFILGTDLVFRTPDKLPGLILLLIFHGSIFLFIYDPNTAGWLSAGRRDRAGTWYD